MDNKNAEITCLPSTEALTIDEIDSSRMWCQMSNNVQEIWELLHRLIDLPSDLPLSSLLTQFEMETNVYNFMYQNNINWKPFTILPEDVSLSKQSKYERRSEAFYQRVLNQYEKRFPTDENTIEWFRYKRAERTWWKPHVWKIIMVLYHMQHDQELYTLMKEANILDWMVQDNYDQIRKKMIRRFRGRFLPKFWETRPKVFMPNIACQLVTHCLGRWNSKLQGWSVVKILGSGVLGTTLLLSDPKGATVRALKIMIVNPQAQWIPVEEEVRLQTKAANAGLAAQVYERFSKHGSVAILTERMHVTLRHVIECWYQLTQIPEHAEKAHDMLQQIIVGLDELFEGLHRLQLTHGDLHAENIMATLHYKQGKLFISLKLIDFGMASDRIYLPQLDVCKLMGDFTSKGYEEGNAFAARWSTNISTMMKRFFELDRGLRKMTPNFFRKKWSARYYSSLFDQIYRSYMEEANPAGQASEFV